MTDRNDSRAEWKEIPVLSVAYLRQLVDTAEEEGYVNPVSRGETSARSSEVEYMSAVIAAVLISQSTRLTFH